VKKTSTQTRSPTRGKVSPQRSRVPARSVVPGSRSRGKARAADILAAARELLTGEVEAPFTLRNVADHAGLRMSHLQYYFATKDDLVRGLLAKVAAEYAARRIEILASVPATPTARFMAWVDFLLLDCWDPRVRRFFIRLWGLVESVDGDAGQLLREFYATDIGEIAALLAELSPHFSRDLVERRASIIAGVIEGMMVMVGSGPANSAERKALFAETRKQIFRIATDA
jgi:AcrR family transcriptional regulator